MASRQWHWKLARITAGLCGQCGREPLVSITMGSRCLRKSRRYGARQGHRPSRDGVRGRPRVKITE